jgi:hypothetical protein
VVDQLESLGEGEMSRPLVYVFAYACDPNAGSEPGTGWAWLAAALEMNDVRLFTDSHNSLEDIWSRAAVLPGRLEVEVVALGAISARIDIASRFRHIRYLSWVRRAGKRARSLEA